MALPVPPVRKKTVTILPLRRVHMRANSCTPPAKFNITLSVACTRRTSNINCSTSWYVSTDDAGTYLGRECAGQWWNSFFLNLIYFLFNFFFFAVSFKNVFLHNSY
uniref:Uncharacterized protein n=1 Tax=Anguilla anguilla TaxID=7936 RepID=A0A0E9X701_ANGAN